MTFTAGAKLRAADLEARFATLPYRDEHVTTGTEASVTFSGIPSALRSLQIRYTCRLNANGAVSLSYRINGDSGASQYLSTEYGTTDAAFAAVSAPAAASSGVCGLVGGNNTAGEYSGGMVTWGGWHAPHTSRLTSVWQDFGQVTGVGRFARAGGSVYIGSGPYTSITLFPSSNSFEIGSGFYLVGER